MKLFLIFLDRDHDKVLVLFEDVMLHCLESFARTTRPSRGSAITPSIATTYVICHAHVAKPYSLTHISPPHPLNCMVPFILVIFPPSFFTLEKEFAGLERGALKPTEIE
ncbi:hypothetical protein EUGRSUZ_C02639 [Eucalyptus grandis]|uniref:Uncharacterized protein n=2 Tax=Eucalyptus grandis TaxID=71139 RepID=A0ACC3LG86_EUCGR|nr:hypothetical protein EUGRSUZ_C02639 [Eucalyptus grandis]